MSLPADPGKAPLLLLPGLAFVPLGYASRRSRRRGPRTLVERRAKGAPVRTLVCSAEPGDCPAGTTCVAARHHCR